MKLLSEKFVKDGAGDVKVIPEETEDLWQAYNLVRQGDVLTATTFRKVSREKGNSVETERVKVKLSLEVDSVDFDPEGAEIRVSGRNLTESEHVRLGAYHTVTLDLNRAFQLHKAEWDALDVERLRDACDPAKSADLAVLLVTDGLANLVLVGKSCTLTRAKIEHSLPRKHGAASAGYDKALQKFNDACLQAVLKHVDFSIVRCLVIAGPGFVKENVKSYLDAEVRSSARSRGAIAAPPPFGIGRTVLGGSHALSALWARHDFLSCCAPTLCAGIGLFDQSLRANQSPFAVHAEPVTGASEPKAVADLRGSQADSGPSRIARLSGDPFPAGPACSLTGEGGAALRRNSAVSRHNADLQAVRQDIRSLIQNREKIVLAPASSAYKHSLKEVLGASGIGDQIKDTMASREVKALGDFQAMLSNCPARAFYGPGHVNAAAELGAVQTLLITDGVFRVNDIQKRRAITRLVEGCRAVVCAARGMPPADSRSWCVKRAGLVHSGILNHDLVRVAGVREAGGEVLIFSTMHVSGQQLEKLTGIAAILRFPLEELEDEELPVPW
eukprot:CAMPEP_0177625200 /NCGR_PEP_ID=MMETSP0419_2-20121207/29956_1 /TAXON_ID=582737 /ORGANISM="Tetraselmis sp., Strain GSL018" /LENGTH=556 /DNA_ID=CAMNT_0019126097 /DNA_START=340 /DNA_END=2013 /DNA_ORIENTATION=-